MNPYERFTNKIRISITRFYEGTPCWEWTATISPSGYGMFHYDGNMMPAHRFSYMYSKGKLNPQMDIDHLCRNRACTNPDHLQQVPHKENVLRGIGLAAINKRKTHCKRGHEFTPENTIKGRNNARHCRECHKIHVKKYEQSHKEQIKRTKQKYADNNRERINAVTAQWRDKNRERVNKLARERRNENRDLANQKQQEYRDKNRERIKRVARARYQLNKEKLLKKSLDYAKNHRESINRRRREVAAGKRKQKQEEKSPNEN